MSRRIWGVIAIGAVGSLVCVGATAASAAPTKSATRHVLTLSVTKNSNVKGSNHTAPGRVQLHITGAKGHLFQLVSPRGPHIGKSTLVSDTNTLNSTGSPKSLEAHFKAIGGTPTNSTMFLTLRPGTYLALDIEARRASQNRIHTLHVSGAVTNAAAPKLGGTVTAVGDMAWSKSPRHIAASGYLLFRNHGLHNSNNTHFVDLEKLRAGKTYADVKKVFAGKEDPSQVFDSGPNKSYDSGVLSFGKSQIASYRLVPGKYMLACFFPGRSDGTPHAFMGMYRTIDVG